MEHINRINKATAGRDRATAFNNAVRATLDDCRGEWPRLAELTGLTYAWIKSFAKGRIRNPSAEQVQQVAAYLGIVVQAKKGEHFLTLRPKGLK